MLAETTGWLDRMTGLSSNLQLKLLHTVIIILVLWILRIIVLRFVWKRTEDFRTRYLWKKFLTYLLYTIGLILVGNILLEDFSQLGTFLGLLTAGIAIALKDPLTNIAGWLFILIQRPFTLGDRIQIGSNAGDVIDIRIFQFTIMETGNWVRSDQSTGRIIHIPNGAIFLTPLANYTKGFRYIWNEIPVLVTFESDWKKAKRLLSEIVNNQSEHLGKSARQRLKEASKKYMIFYSHLTPIVYTSVEDSGILLTIRYLCEPRKRRGSENSIWEAILTEFEKHPDVELAYPTIRYFTRQTKQQRNSD
jgi:small-conductance mechanosensitive channel